MIAKGIMCFALVVACVSCKSHEAVVSNATHHSKLSIQNSSHDTLVVHDSILLHDSIIYRERTIHDTVYITKEVYRDAHNSKCKIQNSIVRDTVVDVRIEKEVVQLPPERYVPKFYKVSTFGLWILLALIVIWQLIKLMLKIAR